MKLPARVPLLLSSLLLAGILVILYSFYSGYRSRADPEPWKDSQLMSPAALQQRLTDKKSSAPLVLSIGPGAVIKGSEDIGAVHEDSNMARFRQRLSSLPRNKELIIYCGCCPFVHCPNIRPAFAVLNEMKFTNASLLNIEHNIKTDWISKGYLTNP